MDNEKAKIGYWTHGGASAAVPVRHANTFNGACQFPSIKHLSRGRERQILDIITMTCTDVHR